MIKYKCKCGNTADFFIEHNLGQCGLYCGECGKWQKWLNKDEERLFHYKLGIKAHDAKVKAEAIEKFKEVCVEKMEEIRKEYFRIAKGHVMPERRTYIKMADVMGMAIEILLIKAEQLKEQNNE